MISLPAHLDSLTDCKSVLVADETTTQGGSHKTIESSKSLNLQMYRFLSFWFIYQMHFSRNKIVFSGQGLLRRTTHYSFPHPHVRNKSYRFLDKSFIFDCINIQLCCFPRGWHGNHLIVILTNDSIFGRSTYKECQFDATGDPSILLINWQPQSMNWKSLPIIIHINLETFVFRLNLLLIFH